MILYGVEIVDLSEEGNGIGRHEGKVVFVEGALPGEVVDVRVVKSKRKFDVGVVECFGKLSDSRVSPGCRHFGVCGGCSLQHLSYGDSLVFKKRWVESDFRKIAGLDVVVEEVLASPVVFGYRNKVVFHGFMDGSSFKLGYYRKGGRSFVEVSECLLVPFLFIGLKGSVEKWCNELGFFPGEVMFRVGKDGCVVVSFFGLLDVSCGFSEGVCGGVASFCLGSGFSVVGVVFFGESGARVFSFGVVDLVMELGGRDFLVSPESFFQVNVSAAGVLFGELVGLLKEKGYSSGRLFDLYCGVGVVGVSLGFLFGSVFGFEVVESAVELARVNAGSNGLVDFLFSAGRVVDFIRGVSFVGGDVVVVDPPRGGLESGVVDLIGKSGVGVVVYVGCGLGKMVRDVGGLVSFGFVVERVFCVDLFPWTGHVETVVLMSRVEK